MVAPNPVRLEAGLDPPHAPVRTRMAAATGALKRLHILRPSCPAWAGKPGPSRAGEGGGARCRGSGGPGQIVVLGRHGRGVTVAPLLVSSPGRPNRPGGRRCLGGTGIGLDPAEPPAIRPPVVVSRDQATACQ